MDLDPESLGLRGMSGDRAGAIAELEELLTDQRRILGPGHPEIQTTHEMLATFRR